MNDGIVKKKHEEVQIKRQYANGQKWGGVEAPVGDHPRITEGV